MYLLKIFARPFSETCPIAYLVFKVRLLKKVLGVGLLCVLFGDKFTKVVKIAENIIELLCVLFKGEAAFA
jgi:hypothetical protein